MSWNNLENKRDERTSGFSPSPQIAKMPKFSAEMIRFLKGEEELTWKVPGNYVTQDCGENVTVHYHPLLMKFGSREESHNPNNPKLQLVVTFDKDESVLGQLFLRKPSPIHPAPSLKRHYHIRSTIGVRTTEGFYYESLTEGRIALERVRQMLKAKRMPHCRTGDFDSLFNVIYVEAEGSKGWIKYRPLTTSWTPVTSHDDENMATIDLTGDNFEGSDYSCQRPPPRNQPVDVTPAMRDQEPRTSGATARVPSMSSGQEVDSIRVPSRKNVKQRLKKRIRDRMQRFYPYLKWSFGKPGEMSYSREDNTEPRSEEEQTKMMDIKNEIRALFEKLKPGSSVELPNPKLPDDGLP